MLMDNWRRLAAEAKVGKAVNSTPAERDVDHASDEDWGLPADLAKNLHRLKLMTAPRRLQRFEMWQAVVMDALRLAADGWASRALALGWTPIDLFGTGREDSHDYSGLAVWLEGRTLLLLEADVAVARTQAGRRAYFHRGGLQHGANVDHPPVFLWEFGR